MKIRFVPATHSIFFPYKRSIAMREGVASNRNSQFLKRIFTSYRYFSSNNNEEGPFPWCKPVTIGDAKIKISKPFLIPGGKAQDTKYLDRTYKIQSCYRAFQEEVYPIDGDEHRVVYEKHY